MFASDRDKQNVLASARWVWDQSEITLASALKIGRDWSQAPKLIFFGWALPENFKRPSSQA